MAALSDHEELRTLEIYEFFCKYFAEKSISPTLEEIATACLTSKANVPSYLARLEGWGWIERQYRIPRSIRYGEKSPTKEDFKKLIADKRGK